jgi:hypothetical protein
MTKYCGAVVDPLDGGVPWNNPSNVIGDTTNTFADSLPAFSGYTSKLCCSQFGFQIPSGATINGIVAEVEHGCDTASFVYDSTISILKGGTEVGTNHSQGLAWGTKEITSYGLNTTDLWGLTPTAEYINASDFGLTIKAVRWAWSGSTPGKVFRVRLTIYYTGGVAPTTRKRIRVM